MAIDKKKALDEFCSLILTSKNIVVLTGAGISTLSGIPDFRGQGGEYTKDFEGMAVEEILSIDFFYSHPEVFYAWAKDVWFNLEKYEPNVVHRVLAKLEEREVVKSIFTQNIDMLHQKAGSKEVYELHGSAFWNSCTKCKKKYSYEEVAKEVKKGIVPKCKSCGGLIKPDIILYDESLRADVLERAYEDFSKAKMTLVLGSSLVVQPASGLPYLTYQGGGKVVIVNKDETYLDGYATLRLEDLRESFEYIESRL